MDLNALRAATQGISAHRELMGTAIMQMTDQIFLMLAYQNGENALNAYAELFYALRKEGCEGLGDWLWDYLLPARNNPSCLSGCMLATGHTLFHLYFGTIA